MIVLQTKKNNKNHTLCVDVLSDKNNWKKVLNKTVNKFIKSGNVKGFRAGHIPFDVALKQIKETKLYSEGIQEIVSITFNELLNSNFVSNNNIIEDAPQIKILSVNDAEVKIQYIFDISPNVILGDYKKAFKNYVKPTTSELEIDNQLQMFVKKINVIHTKQTSEIVSKNSLVTIDYQGTIDNHPFPGSSDSKYNLTIGSGDFLPGFEEKLIGHKVNDEVKFQLTTPSDFYLENLANKKVDYIVKIKSISNSDYHTITDNFVKKLSIKNVNSVSQLKEWFRYKILIQKANIQREQIKQKITDILSKESKIDFIPESIFNQQRKSIIEQYRQISKNKGLSLEGFVCKDQSIGTMTNFYELVDKKVVENVKLMFAIDKLIDEYKIESTEKERKNILNSLSVKYNMSIDDVENKVGNEYQILIANLLKDKLFNKLISLIEGK